MNLLTAEQEKELNIIEWEASYTREKFIDTMELNTLGSVKGEHIGVTIETYLECNCYLAMDSDVKDWSCGEKFFFQWEGKWFTSIYQYDSPEDAYKAGIECLDKLFYMVPRGTAQKRELVKELRKRGVELEVFSSGCADDNYLKVTVDGLEMLSVDGEFTIP